ncbi:hsp70 family chaperone [Colletotrichum tofieldiae]|uniref:Hsp70 family chaperone n=1 Tax=Colletotrichum tofieldiae TaxID=708197 RepID=A0A166XUE2_9PEZI|nr:hsp70 family chaperone [Colletotrichum tofieldiae]
MAEKTEIFVSVDLGTTFTGVAWMTPKTPIQIINDWPGSGDRGERKVPTVLIYNSDNTLSSWGFMCEDDDDTTPGKIRREFFKIFLDEDTLAAAKQQGLSNTPQNTVDAQRFMTDYLQQVYEHIKESIETQIGRRHFGGWTDMAVKFLFSVPTTWTKMSVVNAFKEVIRGAGFGVEGTKHVAQVDLTEAEAAAVATLKTSPVQFHLGSLFLTVDAGGGTTDLALMQVTSVDESFPQMSQIAAVKGVGIGSMLIDRAFIRLVSLRLAAYPETQGRMPVDLPVRMSRSHHFRTVKHKFGERAYMQPVYRIQMEGVSHDFNHPGLGVENGKMLFSREEFMALFEVQIKGIMLRIKEQLDWLSDSRQSQQVEHMILSGGLGSSAYVRDRLQQQFTSYPHTNACQMAVIPCQDPQLVVVRGLLLDPQQRKNSENLSVLATRIARASYGVLVRHVYSPLLHANEEMETDQFDPRQRWAVNQIQWLVRKGDVINPNKPIVKSFDVRLGPTETKRSWDARILISHNEAELLPKSMRHDGASKLCDVKSNLEGVQQEQLVLKEKRGTCFSRGFKYYICSFDVRVIVAPADLRFELWFGGQKFSKSHEPITVLWDEEGANIGGTG